MQRHVEAERLGGFEVDDQFVLGRRLDRQVGRLFALEDAIGIRRRAPIIIEEIISVGQKTAKFGEEAERIDGRETVASGQRYDFTSVVTLTLVSHGRPFRGFGRRTWSR
jgi:hypothetical protein